MGADGWIDIYDFDLIERDGLGELKDLFCTGYTRTFCGRNILHVYNETERSWFGIDCDRRNTFVQKNRAAIGLILGEGNLEDMYDGEIFDELMERYYMDNWEVWT